MLYSGVPTSSIDNSLTPLTVASPTATQSFGSFPQGSSAAVVQNASPDKPPQKILARDRITRWSSAAAETASNPNAIKFLHATPEKYIDAINIALEPNTRTTYGAGLVRLKEFCDAEGVEEQFRFPTEEYVLLNFFASYVGRISGSAARNWEHGLAAWHKASNVKWQKSDRVEWVLRAIEKTTPSSSIRDPRPPVTVEMLEMLHRRLDLSAPMDAAVYAVACCAFYGMRRLGEVVVKQGRPLSHHVTRGALHFSTDSAGIPTASCHLPWTKTTRERGFDVVWAIQTGCVDPLAALQAHLAINSLPDSELLFSYLGSDGQAQHMSDKIFLSRVNAIWSAEGLSIVQGHSFRIGGAVEMLKAGVPPEVVAAAGPWQSLSFLRYWREPEKVLPMHTANLSSRTKVINSIPSPAPNASGAGRRRRTLPARTA